MAYSSINNGFITQWAAYVFGGRGAFPSGLSAEAELQRMTLITAASPTQTREHPQLWQNAPIHETITSAYIIQPSHGVLQLYIQYIY